MTSISIDRNLEVPARDGTILRGDLYRASDEPRPTLLMRTPYGKENPMGLMVVLDPLKAVSAGYSVFIQDVRGRFASDGDFMPFINEAPDGFDTIEWVASQPWSNGRVGMYGSSYMAATQLQAATLAPPALQAICPIGGSADYYEGRSYRGGACERGSLLSIALMAIGTGTLRRTKQGEDLRKGLNEIKAMLANLPGIAAMPAAELKQTVLKDCVPFFFDWLENDAPGPYWEALDVAVRHDRIAVPMLHITSWFDAFAPGAIANYRGLSERAATERARSNQCLWIGPWGHYMPRTVVYGAGRLGELDFGLDALTDLDSVQIGWFDKWLKDKEGAWRGRTPVRVFVLGRNSWHDLPDWPPAAESKSLFLAPDNELRDSPPDEAEASDRYEADPNDPVPTHGGAHLMLESAFPQGPLDQARIERRGDIVLYTSEALTRDLTIIGQVELDVWVASSAPSIDLVATMSVVTPDGLSINLVDGVRRVVLNSEQPQAVTVTLGVLARDFTAGERIRLRIAGSNFPRYDLNPQTGERACEASVRVRAPHSIFRDAGHPSALRLPVYAGEF